MAVSMKELFGRRGISDECISLRHSLEGHVGGVGKGLREADREFRMLDTGSGFTAGCRIPDSIKVDAVVATRQMGMILPAWVNVDHRDHREKPHLIEGRVRMSRITPEDFPLRPWHTFYDWNFFVEIDPQYRYRINETTRRHHSKKFRLEDDADIIECEWDSAFLPLWAVPQDGVRVLIIGRWIYDCGHPPEIRVRIGEPGGVGGVVVKTAYTRERLSELLDSGGVIMQDSNNENIPELLGMHRMEIHPPRGIVSYVSEAARFPGQLRATRATKAVLFLGREGGYVRQNLNDQDYAFDLHLPARPHPAAIPLHMFESMTGTLPVGPTITPFPPNNPKLLRVVIPLKGVTPLTSEYGLIVSAGWSDPTGTTANEVSRFRITIQKIVRNDSPVVPFGGAGTVRFRRLVLFVGVNGRWHRQDIGPSFVPAVVGEEVEQARVIPINFVTELDLHRDDTLHITATGFFALRIFDFMGKESGVADAVVSSGTDVDVAVSAAKKVRDAFADLPIPTTEGNDPINLLGVIHNPVRVGAFERSSMDHPGPATEDLDSISKPSPERDYVLHYVIEKLDSLLA